MKFSTPPPVENRSVIPRPDAESTSFQQPQQPTVIGLLKPLAHFLGASRAIYGNKKGNLAVSSFGVGSVSWAKAGAAIMVDAASAAAIAIRILKLLNSTRARVGALMTLRRTSCMNVG